MRYGVRRRVPARVSIGREAAPGVGWADRHGRAPMADVFVSYSRRDGAFVSQLHEALHARGKQVWVDVEGIRDAEVFPAAIRSAIESSDAFAFVISPDSVESPFCAQE